MIIEVSHREDRLKAKEVVSDLFNHGRGVSAILLRVDDLEALLNDIVIVGEVDIESVRQNDGVVDCRACRVFEPFSPLACIRQARGLEDGLHLHVCEIVSVVGLALEVESVRKREFVRDEWWCDVGGVCRRGRESAADSSDGHNKEPTGQIEEQHDELGLAGKTCCSVGSFDMKKKERGLVLENGGSMRFPLARFTSAEWVNILRRCAS